MLCPAYPWPNSHHPPIEALQGTACYQYGERAKQRCNSTDRMAVISLANPRENT